MENPNSNLDLNQKIIMLNSIMKNIQIDNVPMFDITWVKDILQFSKEDEIKLKRQERIDKLKKINNES